jgi:hypothetical protein
MAEVDELLSNIPLPTQRSSIRGGGLPADQLVPKLPVPHNPLQRTITWSG